MPQAMEGRGPGNGEHKVCTEWTLLCTPLAANPSWEKAQCDTAVLILLQHLVDPLQVSDVDCVSAASRKMVFCFLSLQYPLRRSRCAAAYTEQRKPEWHYSTVCGFWQVCCATLYDIHLLQWILARLRCCSEKRHGEPATQVSFQPIIQAASPTSHLYSHPSTNQAIHSLKLSLEAKQATSDF